MHWTLILVVFCVMVIACGALADPPAPAATAPSTRPAVDNGWDASWFKYERPAKREFIVEETTPTAARLSFYGRPPQMSDAAIDPSLIHAKPQRVKDVNILRLRFRDADAQIVPVLLCTPATKRGPFPVVIASHGLGSNKAQVCGQVAPALCKRGFAVIAPDLPLHGERPGSPQDLRGMALREPQRAFELYRRGVRDVRQCIDLAETRPELDTSAGVTLVGYSMGSWIDAVTGAADERVKQMVLMVGGAHDVPALLLAMPQAAACYPALAIAHFAPRPLLMLNGKSDYVVTPEMARRLYAGASEPKEQRWYVSGHLLPERAYEDAAEWIETYVAAAAAK